MHNLHKGGKKQTPENTSTMKVESISYKRIILQKATACLVFLIVNQAAICVAEEIPGTFSLRSSGARPMGMAEVFTAPADDVNALWFNPAGIAQLTKNEVGSMYTNLYGVEKLYYSALGFAMPVRGLGSIGIGWTRLAAGEVLETDESGNIIRYSSQKENALTFSYGRSIFKEDIIFLGGNLWYLHAGALASNSGWSIDLGLLGKPIPQLSVGLVAQQLAGELTVKETGESRMLPRNINAAAALDLGNYLPDSRDVASLHLSAEVSNITSAHYRKIGLGTEIWLLDGLLGLRAGLRRRLAENANLLFSLGASVKIADYLRLDYAYLAHPILADSHILSAHISFLTVPQPVKIVAVVMLKELFPAQRLYYANNPVCTVRLEEISGRSFDNVKISLFIPKYMDSSSEVITKLKAQSTSEIKLSAVLNEKVYEVDENIPINAEIIVKYYDGGEEREIRRTCLVILYSRNTMDWRVPESFAAFITHNDSVIGDFVSEIFNRMTPGESKLLQAMLLFDAIAVHPVQYFPDARINRISPEEKVPLDKIQYPRESLKRKMGDCDDWTATYGACLESVGISTAIVLAPRHVFLMLDTGIPSRDAEMIILDEKLYIEGENGHVWLPIEVTMLRDGSFIDAWMEGIREYRKYEEAGGLKVIYTEKAQETYPPVGLPAELSAISLPSVNATTSVFEKDFKEYDEIYQEIVERKKNEISNNSAVSLAKIGEYEAAEKIFHQLPMNVATRINLGNLYCLTRKKEKLESALENYYDKVPRDHPRYPLVLLNEGLLHLMLSMDSTDMREAQKLRLKAEEFFASALQSLMGPLDKLSGEDRENRLKETYQAVSRLLALDLEPLLKGKEKVKKKLSSEEVRRLLEKAKQKLEKKKEVDVHPERPKEVIVRRGIDPKDERELSFWLNWIKE